MRLCKSKRLSTHLKQPYFVLRNLLGLKSGGIDKMRRNRHVFAMKLCLAKTPQLEFVKLPLQIEQSTKSYFQ